MRPTLAVINKKNLISNYLNIKKYVNNAKIMAIIKADAYGHGMVKIAEILNTSGEKKPDYFGVAIIEEAVELRKAKIKQPILLLSPVLRYNVEDIIKYNIIPTVFNSDHLNLIKKFSGNKKIKVHIKVDTGMSRLGVKYNEAAGFIKKVSGDNSFVIDGIFTHFAESESEDRSFSLLQIARFNEVIDQLKKEHIEFGIVHAANSGGIINLKEAHYDMVRPGISLYGYYPVENMCTRLKLKPVMSLVSKVINVKNLDVGDSVSYGRRFIAVKPTKVAVASIGYADGFVRELSGKASAIIKGKLCRQIGIGCMDVTMFEVDEKVKTEDLIILMGKKDKYEITAWDWANIVGTIPYEITCKIGKRVPRIYI